MPHNSNSVACMIASSCESIKHNCRDNRAPRHRWTRPKCRRHNTLQRGDIDAATSAQHIQGEYHCLSDSFGGRPIWRQEHPTPPPLFIFYSDSKSDGGWNAADSIIDPNIRADFKGTIHAYFGGTGSMPGTAHLPYWTKNKNKGILVEPLAHSVQWRIAALEDNAASGSARATPAVDTTDTADLRSEFYEAMEKRTEDADARNAENGMRIDALDALATNDGGGCKSDGKCSSSKSGVKQKDNEPGHGGYAPKLARLVMAIHAKDWTAVGKLARNHYASPLIRKNMRPRRARKAWLDKSVVDTAQCGQRVQSYIYIYIYIYITYLNLFLHSIKLYI
jgi:hypothetical protein